MKTLIISVLVILITGTFMGCKAIHIYVAHNPEDPYGYWIMVVFCIVQILIALVSGMTIARRKMLIQMGETGRGRTASMDWVHKHPDEFKSWGKS